MEYIFFENNGIKLGIKNDKITRKPLYILKWNNQLLYVPWISLETSVEILKCVKWND